MLAMPNSRSPFGGGSSSLDRLPMLRTVFERAVLACTQELRALATPPPMLSFAGLEAATAAEMFAQHDGAIVTAILHAPGWNTKFLISARRSAVFTIVELLLGGDGSQPPYAGKRPFSKIETRVAGTFFERFAKALSAATALVTPTTLRLDALANAIDFDILGNRGTPLFGAKLKFEALGRDGDILLAMPQAAIAAMRQAFERAASKETARPDPRWAEQIEREVTRASITLQAVLDERPMHLAEIAGLNVGQVLELQATPRTRVHLEADGQRMILCQFGKSNGVYTLRVDDFVDREREFMNDILAG
jgi:flagellar motor switch protein FliM